VAVGKPVNVHEAKTHLSRLLDRAAKGEEIVIAKAGRPVAKLVPYRAAVAPRQPGAWKGKVWIAPDFDETSEEIIRLFEGGDEDFGEQEAQPKQ
jgi:prevent-host-death family protein